MLEIAALITLGLFAGTMAAALGLGGGVIFVPSLVVLFGFEQHIAQGTSLAVIFPTAIVATIAHAKMGNVRWHLSVPIGLAGIAGAVLGARVALQLDADLPLPSYAHEGDAGLDLYASEGLVLAAEYGIIGAFAVAAPLLDPLLFEEGCSVSL